MTYGPEFLEKIKTSPTITVTGPQRSGTRIATAIIAAALNRTFIGEEEYRVSRLEGRFGRYLAAADGAGEKVIHAPALSGLAHHMPGIVVFMRRPLEDIIASQQRIDWAWEHTEFLDYFVDKGPIAQVKYDAWDKYQKPSLKDRAVDLDYRSLHHHPMWVSKERRIAFHPHQIGPAGRDRL